MWSLHFSQAFQQYKIYKFWSSFACQIKSILKRNKKKTKIKGKGTYLRKPEKLAGGSEQKQPSHPLPLSVATAAVEPPPRALSSVPPEPPRARIRCAASPSLLSLGFLSLPCPVSTTKANPSRHRVRARRRSAIAGVPARHCRIAATRGCASTSSPSSPSLACWDDVISPPSSKHCRDPDRRSSSISSSPASLRHRRLSHRVRGEDAHLPDPFPLSISSWSVDMVRFSGRRVSGVTPPCAIVNGSVSGDR